MRQVNYSAILRILVFTLILFGFNQVKAQFNSKEIFRTDYFIENTGQYKVLFPSKKNIDYVLNDKGQEFLLHSKGFNIHLSQFIYDEKRHREETNHKESKKDFYNKVEDSVDFEWLGANSSASPNGDNNNDAIKPRFICEVEVILDAFEYQIFNRWGQQVFQTNNLDEGWNGKFDGENQPVSTYFYSIKYKSPGNSENKMVRGDITLIR